MAHIEFIHCGAINHVACMQFREGVIKRDGLNDSAFGCSEAPAITTTRGYAIGAIDKLISAAAAISKPIFERRSAASTNGSVSNVFNTFFFGFVACIGWLGANELIDVVTDWVARKGGNAAASNRFKDRK